MPQIVVGTLLKKRKWVCPFCDFWNETLTLSISAYFSDELVVRLMSCNDEELQTHPKLWVLPLLAKCLCAMWIHGSEVINLNFGMQWKIKLHELVFPALCFRHMHISRASSIENAACFIYLCLMFWACGTCNKLSSVMHKKKCPKLKSTPGDIITINEKCFVL